jgi:cytochrome b561
VTLGLVAIHAAAAFYHHLVRRDLVLIRMLRSGPMPRTGSTADTSEKDDTVVERKRI